MLHSVAFLIILGGMAPATALVIPRWLRGKQIPISARIALITTLVLLFSGMFLFLAFEWEGALAGLSFGDKLHNAWFQSVTLRTAGFNTVCIGSITSPTLLFMRSLKSNLLKPFEEIHSVINAFRGGDTMRRCAGKNLPKDIATVFRDVNELLDGFGK